MSIENPSKEIITAVDSAVDWFEKVKIAGLRQIRTYDKNGKLLEKEMVEDVNASFLWARFMELDTNRLSSVTVMVLKICHYCNQKRATKWLSLVHRRTTTSFG